MQFYCHSNSSVQKTQKINDEIQDAFEVMCRFDGVRNFPGKKVRRASRDIVQMCDRRGRGFVRKFLNRVNIQPCVLSLFTLLAGEAALAGERLKRLTPKKQWQTFLYPQWFQKGRQKSDLTMKKCQTIAAMILASGMSVFGQGTTPAPSLPKLEALAKQTTPPAFEFSTENIPAGTHL